MSRIICFALSLFFMMPCIISKAQNQVQEKSTVPFRSALLINPINSCLHVAGLTYLHQRNEKQMWSVTPSVIFPAPFSKTAEAPWTPLRDLMSTGGSILGEWLFFSKVRDNSYDYFALEFAYRYLFFNNRKEVFTIDTGEKLDYRFKQTRHEWVVGFRFGTMKDHQTSYVGNWSVGAGMRFMFLETEVNSCNNCLAERANGEGGYSWGSNPVLLNYYEQFLPYANGFRLEPAFWLTYRLGWILHYDKSKIE